MRDLLASLRDEYSSSHNQLYFSLPLGKGKSFFGNPGIRLLLTQIFQRIAYHKWIKENRLPHAVVRKGQAE